MAASLYLGCEALGLSLTEQPTPARPRYLQGPGLAYFHHGHQGQLLMSWK